MTSPKYRHALPQLADKLFLTDGGIETTLIFHEGFELPHFAAFDLLREKKGRTALENYFGRYATIARDMGVGFVLESATWRASPDWAGKLGYSTDALDTVNREAVEMLFDLRQEFETDATPCVISGCIGPRGDGYNPSEIMSADEAERYHAEQIGTFARAGADMVTAITMTYPEEAIGITRAAQAAGLPAAISFTVETDGRLPTGQSLGEAIVQVDRDTKNGPAYYMINCAHPTHFDEAVTKGGDWLARIHGLRASASTKSHAELDEAEELDDGNPVELGGDYRKLKQILPNLTVLGGCCGTDHRHIAAIGRACAQA